MRVLGIDYGSKRVGLALGDTDSRIAGPWDVIPNEGFDELNDRIGTIVDRDDVERIVVGVPQPLRDRDMENDQVGETMEFIEALKTIGVPIDTVDEALSSKVAATQAAEAGIREKRDDLAAAAILQGWLDQSVA